MSPMKDAHVLRAIDGQATRWFVRNREGALSAQESADFMSWLRSSPQHVDAYLALVELSGKMKLGVRELALEGQPLYERARCTIAQTMARTANVVELVPRAGYVDATPGRKRWPLMAASVLVAVALGVAIFVRRVDPQTVVVPHGEQRVLQLTDGSVAHANSDARLQVRYGAKERVIELKAGQALFKVSADPGRPFIVKTAEMDIVAIGTQFEVDRREHLTTVTVVEGRINILEHGASHAHPLSLSAGQRVELGDHRNARQPVVVDAQQATAWAQSDIIFAGRPLGEVVAEFNRHAGKPIVIEDESLRDYRIHGVFLTYDVDSFVAYLEDLDSMQVERTATAIRVRPRQK